ncbi:hypothetical protein ILYODFUR_012868, partial [Ilyodon furcidens]
PHELQLSRNICQSHPTEWSREQHTPTCTQLFVVSLSKTLYHPCLVMVVRGIGVAVYGSLTSVSASQGNSGYILAHHCQCVNVGNPCTQTGYHIGPSYICYPPGNLSHHNQLVQLPRSPSSISCLFYNDLCTPTLWVLTHLFSLLQNHQNLHSSLNPSYLRQA